MSRRTSADERRSTRDAAGPPTTSLHRHHTRSSSAGDASRIEAAAATGGGSNISPIKPRNSLKNQPPRIVRTFEEVPTVVPAEEWYEELECGICSHVLGCPQTLVPCGHSFCGPCAWEWIKTHRNSTCPHCRVQVHETVGLVPNILLDQIIDRKLNALHEGKEKSGLLADRAEKLEQWKIIQAKNPSSTKTPPKRTRGLDDIMVRLFDHNAGSDGQGGRRRASMHLAALGAPLANDGEIILGGPTSRHSVLPQLEQVRQYREARLGREALHSLRTVNETPEHSAAANAAASTANTPDAPTSPNRSRRHARQPQNTQVTFVVPESPRRETGPTLPQPQALPERTAVPSSSRLPYPRSQPLAARQARGRRYDAAGGSRNHAIEIESDSE